MRLVPTTTGQPGGDQLVEVGAAGPGCARRVLPKPMPGIDPDLGHPGGRGRVGPRRRGSRAPRRPRRRSAGRPASSAGSPCMCMADPADAELGGDRRRARPTTSLMSVAPAADRGPGHRRLAGVDARPGRCGGQRLDDRDDPAQLLGRRDTGSAPGPGRLAADVERRRRPRRRAAGRARPRRRGRANCPPSQNESGVTLTTPMTQTDARAPAVSDATSCPSGGANFAQGGEVSRGCRR